MLPLLKNENPIHRHCFYGYSTLQKVLQSLLIKIVDVCQKAKFSLFPKFSLLIMSYQRSFRTKLRWINLFTTLCAILCSSDKEEHVLAKAPTKNLLQSSFSNHVIWRHSSVISSKSQWVSVTEISVMWSIARRIISKILIQQSIDYRLQYWNPKKGLDLHSQLTTSLLITIKMALNY